MKYLFLFLFYSSCAFSEIVEIQNFHEISSYLTPDSFLILDIDNTLLEPVQELGTDQWFRHRCDYYYQRRDPHALEKAVIEWEAIQKISQVKLVEDNIAAIVKHFQEEGYPLIGMTTRGLGLVTRTIRQLKDLEIDLSKTSLKKEIPLNNPQLILFTEGVFFTRGTHKGKGLMQLLEKIPFSHEKVVFVNDKASHLREVEEECEKRGIAFLGLRYGYLDEKVENFDAQIADIQFTYFSQIPSDEQVREWLYAHSKNA